VHIGGKEKTSLRLVSGAIRWRGEERRCIATKLVHETGRRTTGHLRLDSPTGWPLKTPGEAILRLDRTRARLFAYFSGDGKRWSPLGAQVAPSAPGKVQVGIVASNTSKGRLAVTFDQFKLTQLAAAPVKKK